MRREGPINLEKVPYSVFWGQEEMEADVPHPLVMLVTVSTWLDSRGGREVALWLFHGWQMWRVQAELLPWGLELSSSTSCCVPLVGVGAVREGVLQTLPGTFLSGWREFCPC